MDRRRDAFFASSSNDAGASTSVAGSNGLPMRHWANALTSRSVSWSAIDWYDTPRYYDIVFDTDTKREADFLEEMLRRHGRATGARAIDHRSAPQYTHEQREVAAAGPPEPVRDAKSLQRHIALEVQERRQQRRGRGIVIDDTGKIAAGGLDEAWLGGKGLAGDAGESRAIRVTGAEPLADLQRQRTAEVGMLEDGFRQRLREHGIACRDRLRLAADGVPELFG